MKNMKRLFSWLLVITMLTQHLFAGAVGTYDLSGETPETPVLLGDVNGDGSITGADTNLIFRYVSGVFDFTDEQIAAADINGDGSVTGTDTNLVFRFVSNYLPPEADHAFAVVTDAQWINGTEGDGYALATLRYLDGSTESVKVAYVDNNRAQYAEDSDYGDPTKTFEFGYVYTTLQYNDTANQHLYALTAMPGDFFALNQIENHFENAVISPGVAQVTADNGIFYTDNNTRYLIYDTETAQYTEVTGCDNLPDTYIADSVDVLYDDNNEFASYVYIISTAAPEVTMELYVNNDNVQITGYVSVYFYLNTNLEVDSISLYDVSQGSEVLIGTMLDDGKVSSSGDDMKGDGTYSFIYSFYPEEDMELTFRAVYDDAESNTVTVSFYTDLSYEELENLETANEQISELVNNFEALTEEEQVDAAQELINQMAEEGIIDADSVDFNEEANVFSFEYEGGVLGGIMCGEFDADLNGRMPNGGNAVVYDTSTNSYESWDELLNTDIGTALILNSFPEFESDWSSIQFRSDFYVDLQNEWNNMGLHTTLDTSVTVEDYKTLGNYSIVCFSTHGSTYNKLPALCLAEMSTKSKDALYSAELKGGHIAIVNGCYWILPSFFTQTYGASGLNGAFVFSESCQFMGRYGNENLSMADALTNSGATTVVGFHNSVYAVYSRDFMRTYVNALVNGNTTDIAFEDAKSAHGADHKEWYENKYGSGTYNPNMAIAYPILRGDSNATLMHALLNANFELYTSASVPPSHWGAIGDVRSVSSLGDIISPDGTSKRMAIITTGVGSKETAAFLDGTEGSIIYQKFVVPEYVTTLTFSYNFVSEEPMEWVGSQFDDAFGIRIVSDNVTVVDTIYETINTSEWFPVENIDFADGDTTVYETGWFTVSVDISEYAGKTISLCFVIYDKGDSLYDSACLLDNIVLS